MKNPRLSKEKPSKEEIPVPKPKWSEWDGNAMITSFQAVMLSLNYDPDFFSEWSVGKIMNSDPKLKTYNERVVALERYFERYGREPKIALSEFVYLAINKLKWKSLPNKLVNSVSKSSLEIDTLKEGSRIVKKQDRNSRREEAASKSRGIKKFILENWNDIFKQYPNPSTRNVLKYIKTNADIGKPPSLKTIQNYWSEFKSQDLIP